MRRIAEVDLLPGETPVRNGRSAQERRQQRRGGEPLQERAEPCRAPRAPPTGSSAERRALRRSSAGAPRWPPPRTRPEHSERRGQVLDQREAAPPEQEPRHQHDRDGPQAVIDPGGQLEGDGGPAQLGRKDAHASHKQDRERGHEEREPEALADGVDERVAADGGKAPCHLDKEGEACAAEQHGPAELVAEARACLRGRDERSDLEEAADAGDDSQRDARPLAHAHRQQVGASVTGDN